MHYAGVSPLRPSDAISFCRRVQAHRCRLVPLRTLHQAVLCNGQSAHDQRRIHRYSQGFKATRGATPLNSRRSLAAKTHEPYDTRVVRDLVWKDQPNFRGWVCSQCAWAFNPSDPPTGESYEAMKRNFGLRRDEEFASHLCAKHPRKQNPTPNVT
jgi:hypothetical protein